MKSFDEITLSFHYKAFTEKGFTDRDRLAIINYWLFNLLGE
jgi:hypothetical protein